MADKYDVSAEDSIERANKRIRRSTEETFQQTVTGYDSVKVDSSSIQLHGGKEKYALFPVWLLSTSWRGENYLFAMNGQTGANSWVTCPWTRALPASGCWALRLPFPPRPTA